MELFPAPDVPTFKQYEILICLTEACVGEVKERGGGGWVRERERARADRAFDISSGIKLSGFRATEWYANASSVLMNRNKSPVHLMMFLFSVHFIRNTYTPAHLFSSAASRIKSCRPRVSVNVCIKLQNGGKKKISAISATMEWVGHFRTGWSPGMFLTRQSLEFIQNGAQNIRKTSSTRMRCWW